MGSRGLPGPNFPRRTVMEPISRHHQEAGTDVLEHGSSRMSRGPALILAGGAVAVLVILSGAINGGRTSSPGESTHLQPQSTRVYVPGHADVPIGSFDDEQVLALNTCTIVYNSHGRWRRITGIIASASPLAGCGTHSPSPSTTVTATATYAPSTPVLDAFGHCSGWVPRADVRFVGHGGLPCGRR